MKKKEQNRLIAALYCRLSDDDEKDGTSVSIETQEKFLTDFCKTNNITIYDVYIDDGHLRHPFLYRLFAVLYFSCQQKGILYNSTAGRA